MSEIVLKDMSEYPSVVRRVFVTGERRAPRGLMTYDMGFTTIVLLNATSGMPLGVGRALNPAIGAVEAIQLIAGISSPELVLKVAPQFERYSEPDDMLPGARMFWGAYGERVKLQALAQIKKLTSDPLTRQAIITLWDPWLDNIDGKHDYPCTIALHFFIRDGLLDMNTIMRSNDVWLGLPYDVFQFTQLQATMARALGTEPGVYRHTTLSLHLYERDIDAAEDLFQAYADNMGQVRKNYRETFQPQGFGRLGDSFNQIMLRARMILHNEELVGEATPSERWYRDQLYPTS